VVFLYQNLELAPPNHLIDVKPLASFWFQSETYKGGLPMANSIKTYNDYVKLRHNNPNDYYKTDTQRQMFLDQVSSGASVFYEYQEQSNDYQINRR
jgi:hypothetical protein